MAKTMCPRCGVRMTVTPTGKYREHESVAGRVCGSSGEQVEGFEGDVQGPDEDAPEADNPDGDPDQDKA